MGQSVSVSVSGQSSGVTSFNYDKPVISTLSISGVVNAPTDTAGGRFCFFVFVFLFLFFVLFVLSPSFFFILSFFTYVLTHSPSSLLPMRAFFHMRAHDILYVCVYARVCVCIRVCMCVYVCVCYAGGNSLTIGGSNFGTTATVTVAGLNCLVTARTPSVQLICTVPPGQGMVRASFT